MILRFSLKMYELLTSCRLSSFISEGLSSPSKCFRAKEISLFRRCSRES